MTSLGGSPKGLKHRGGLAGVSSPPSSKRRRASSAERLSMRRTQEALPIFGARERLVEAVRRQPVTVVVGETGSGKSTQLPQYLCDEFHLARGQMIAVTQPRRVAAVTVAARVAAERHEPVGQTVGYCVRFDEKSSPATKVRGATCAAAPAPLLSLRGALPADPPGVHPRSNT
jgi:HrpA-like RNA helicase